MKQTQRVRKYSDLTTISFLDQIAVDFDYLGQWPKTAIKCSIFPLLNTFWVEIIIYILSRLRKSNTQRQNRRINDPNEFGLVL